jgi:hypothetical protein
MPQVAWVVLFVLPLALLIRVIFFASVQTRSGGRSRERAAREDGVVPASRGRARPQNETRADETRI